MRELKDLKQAHTHTHLHTKIQKEKEQGETDVEDGADVAVTHTVLEIVAPRLTTGK